MLERGLKTKTSSVIDKGTKKMQKQIDISLQKDDNITERKKVLYFAESAVAVYFHGFSRLVTCKTIAHMRRKIDGPLLDRLN